MSTQYIPERGDVIWVDFSPTVGHEQAGRRPGVVLSPRAYNEPSELAFVCPITNSEKGYAFEVPIPTGLPVTGVILVDQARPVDWRMRNVIFICRMPRQVLDAAKRTLAKLIE